MTGDRTSDQKCCKSRVKSWNKSLSHARSFELESTSSTTLMADEAASHRRSSATCRHGSSLHGQISTSSESSTSSSERRRSSCLSDVSVRSSSSKRSSTGDFSSELDDYFDSVAHRSLQTAVIEEETSHDHDAAPSSAASEPRAGQHLLEHFVDNLMNEAAQQCKNELTTSPSSGLAVSRLQEYASGLAQDMVTGALQEVTRVKERQQRRCSDLTRRTSRQLADGRAGGFERQQTVSGFRDALLSDFDKKLMSSHVTADVRSPMMTFTGSSSSSSQKRRASEPAYLMNTRTTSSSSAECRDVISGWFASARHSPADRALTEFVDNLLTEAFVQSISSLSKAARRQRRRHRASRDVESRDAVCHNVISSYADRLTRCILQAVLSELAECVDVQTVADKFATSIVDDVLREQSSTNQRALVSHAPPQLICV